MTEIERELYEKDIGLWNQKAYIQWLISSNNAIPPSSSFLHFHQLDQEFEWKFWEPLSIKSPTFFILETNYTIISGKYPIMSSYISQMEI